MGVRAKTKIVTLLCILVLPGLIGSAYAKRISDISNTKHNFSATFANTPLPGSNELRVVKAQQETQICVFCHTPHGAETGTNGSEKVPLWNRRLANTSGGPSITYQKYNSSSLDSAGTLTQPTNVSKLCLSCHDGTMAIGAVNVLSGKFTDRDPTTAEIAMQGTSTGGKMAAGQGETTGFTRFLGTDLTNDHPISMTFDSTLASADGEMRDPSTADPKILGVRGPGKKPLIPLMPDDQGNGQVQCNSCHDPHIRDDDTALGNIKFLRANRLQKTQGPQAGYNPNTDIICLACHDKAGWVNSAHANPLVATPTYTNAATDVREFPRGTAVWQTACLACHDTHTVSGSRRLLREGVDGGTKTVTTSGGSISIKTGGKPAIEETCYACHSSDGGTLAGQGTANFQVPNVKTDFTTPGNRHMPITNADQNNGNNNGEVHDIENGDFIESQQTLAKRHAECTDCHNPHRVIRNRLFNADPNSPDNAGTHLHKTADIGTGNMHTNIASGVLRGAWGVEPKYTSNNFNVDPSSFDVKKGMPSTSTQVTETYVTREYQICLKCHSNYAYGNTPPLLGSFGGGTPNGTNQMTQYTNQAREYNSPDGSNGANHSGEGISVGSDGGAAQAYNSNNHRSWHPVIHPTGRTAQPGGIGGGINGNCPPPGQPRDPNNERCADANNWLEPFNMGVGKETMYCTDCHGNNIQASTSVPDGNTGNNENGNVWGPHGSSNNFILKGPWSGDSGFNGPPGTGEGTPNDLCFKCHDYDQFGNTANTNNIHDSGFALAAGANNMCMMGGNGNMGGMGGMGPGGAMCMAMPANMGNGMGGAMNNLHIFHANAVNNFRCNLCHVAVPHGWKNKVFLVNLNDVGPEGGKATGTQVRYVGENGNNTNPAPRYRNGPYYNQAALKVVQFAVSGNWDPSYCGSAGSPGNGETGVRWMAQSNEACVNTP